MTSFIAEGLRRRPTFRSRCGDGSTGGNFLPGRLFLSRGTVRDYDALSPFHYCAARPATWAAIWCVRYDDGQRQRFGPAKNFPALNRARPRIPNRDLARAIAVIVLSYPVPNCAARERFLDRQAFSRKENLIFANRQIRTISRVVVHPQFRSLGLSTLLVFHACRAARVRYVEAIAAMGRIHPFFERAGMQRVAERNPTKPAYFIFDRHAKPEEA